MPHKLCRVPVSDLPLALLVADTEVAEICLLFPGKSNQIWQKLCLQVYIDYHTYSYYYDKTENVYLILYFVVIMSL